MLLVIHPFLYDEDAEEVIGKCDKEQYQKRWTEFEKLKQSLIELGFSPRDDKEYRETGFNCEGLNWEAKAYGEIFTITDQNIDLLQGKANELVALRKQALDKLSPEEQMALGLFEQRKK